MKHKRKLLVLLPLLVVATVVSYKLIRGKYQSDPAAIRVSGNIEVTDVEVSFKISGRLEERAVSEGETVTAGQLVAKLDPGELMQEVAVRRAEVGAVQAALAELVAGSRPEEIREAESAVHKTRAWLDELVAGSRPQDIAAHKATAARAKAEVDRLEAEHTRQETLYRNDVISAREYEATQAALVAAKARLREDQERSKLVVEGPRKEQIEQARASLKQTTERLALVTKGPRHETIDQARARLEQVRQALAVAETRLGYTTVVAPISGVVLSENLEGGSYAAPGTPVVTVGDLVNVWLRAYIAETDLGRVKVGQRVRVTTDTYPGKQYHGRVSFIASQAAFTPKNVQTAKERVKLVYRIKVEIQNPGMELKPGMPADAEILTGPGADGKAHTLDGQRTSPPSRSPSMAPVPKVPNKSMTLVAKEVTDARN
ncbi:MAG TPA: efflux RND transporter periplasmic adaptor subunit [Bryobacteraceae bacterium]|nr:efflux RND transporter periplasmic adaptor subunit [Bryobacteraceae bacterium]